MTVLVFGRTGQVATELARLPGTLCLDRGQADLSDPAACARVLLDQRPQAVINAAAYTAVDRAEDEESLATVINGQAPGAMAQACVALGIPLVQISTDYVFEGSGDAPWLPDAVPAPLGAYGRSKLAGEQAVIAAGGIYGILRTSWVVSAHGNNFVKTMLRLGETRSSLNVVADQIGGPTPARDIAVACFEMAQQLQADPGKSGLYHFSGQEDCSWADFARAIFERAQVSCAVTDIPSAHYPTPAVRPANSRLECSSLHSVFGIKRPQWRVGLSDILTDLGH